MKTCRSCGETKSIEEFHRNRNRPDGSEPRCKVCRHNTYLLKAPEAIAQMSARYYASKPGPRVCIDCGVPVRGLGWRCKPCGLERQHLMQLEYKRNNPIKMRESKRRSTLKRYHNDEDYRARSILLASERHRKLKSDASTLDFMLILRSDPCSYCGEDAGSIDHIAPIVHGGVHHWENLTATCVKCNSSKNAREDLLRWMWERHERRSVPVGTGASS